MLLTIPFILKNERFGNLLTILKGKNSSEVRSQDERIIIWESAIKVLRNNVLIGSGIGDAREELVKEYNRAGAEKQSSNHMNAHNQFLQISVESGIIGLLFFMVIICFMAYAAVTGKNLLYGLFLIMMLIFFMFESVLYRFAGISFFSLFSFLLMDLKNNIEIRENRISNPLSNE
jgi:O-antigen ligase